MMMPSVMKALGMLSSHATCLPRGFLLEHLLGPAEGHQGISRLTAALQLSTPPLVTFATPCLAFHATASPIAAEAASMASAAASATEDGRPSTSTSTSSSRSGPAERQQSYAYGPRKVTMLRRNTAVAALEGIVHIHCTSNNVILTLTDKLGLVKACTSAGMAGFRNARKSQPMAAEKAAEELARKAVALGYGSVVVKLKGMGNNKQYAVQSLHAAGLRVTHLMDVTPIPYNGCRPPKRRRV